MSHFSNMFHLTWAAALLGGGAILYLLITSVVSYRRLRHIKGPRLAAWSQLWLFNVTAKGNLYLAAEDVLRKYGSPARIGPNMIIHADPEIARFVSAPRSPFRRGHWYSGMKFDPRIDNLLSERDEKRHTELRAKMMPGYTGKEVPTMEDKIDRRLLDFMDLIQREYVSKSLPFDFAEKVQYFTLDSLTDMAFGYPFGYLTQNSDLFDYNKSSTQFFPIMELATNIPFIHSIISSRFMQSIAGPKPEDKVGLGAVIGVAQKIVRQRFRPTDEGTKSNRDRDMMDAFIKHGLTQLEVESESLLQILAGSDSTATSIRMTLLYLLTNPPVYAKLRAEIDEALANGQISFPVVKNSESLKLLYLQAVIKEGIRLWQPLNGIVTKDSPNEDLTINGVYIPAGTQVCLSQHVMMRRKDLFGDDAEVFRPERWIPQTGDDVGKMKEQDRMWDLSFGTGRFSCLGKNIALMELNKVFVELFRRYDFGIVNPVQTLTTRCHQLHVQKDFNIRASARGQ